MKQRWTTEKLRELINTSIPAGSITPEHTEKGHFYGHACREYCGKLAKSGKLVFPSVTGKLQIIKDESLINWKMNQALQYIFANFETINTQNILEHLEKAKNIPSDVLSDAGDVGKEIHQCREDYFNDWIQKGSKPASTLNFIKPQQIDPRIHSAMRALQKFVDDTEYVPVWSELLVDNHALKTAGTLDDLGLMWHADKSKGNPFCLHATRFITEDGLKRVCPECGRSEDWSFVLMDIKSSNQFKDHYFFQVALYYWMFYKMVGIRPERCFILRLDKFNGQYKIEDLKRPAMLASYARSMIRTHNGIEFIKNLRKDNQKVVAEKIEL